MMERGPSFPEGGSRNGHVHMRLASGGYTLIYEVHSDGSAGKVDGFLTIWWDKNTNLYYFLACFNNPNGPCRMRAAHWDGDSFVNDHDSVAHGNKTRWRDTFTFTVTSHTLVAAMDSGSGAMRPMITTTATRTSARAPQSGGEKGMVLPSGTIPQPVQAQYLVVGVPQPGPNFLRLNRTIARAEVAIEHLCDFFNRARFFDLVQRSAYAVVKEAAVCIGRLTDLRFSGLKVQLL